MPGEQERPVDPARLAREDGGAAPGKGRGAWGVEQRWKILSSCLATEPGAVVALGDGMEDTKSEVPAFTSPTRNETMDSADFKGEPFHDTVLVMDACREEGSEEVETEPPRWSPFFIIRRRVKFDFSSSATRALRTAHSLRIQGGIIEWEKEKEARKREKASRKRHERINTEDRDKVRCPVVVASSSGRRSA